MTTASAPVSGADPPSIDVAFLQAGEVLEDVVAQVAADAWNDPSPCEGWSVRDVVGHVVQSTLKIAALVRHEPFLRDDEHPAGAAGDDPLAALRAACGPAREAVKHGDLSRTTEAMHGQRTVASALAFPVADLAVHAWDIAHATGQGGLRLPPELLAHIVHTTDQVPDDVLRGPGRFGPARPVADRADDTTRLMAWLGRDTTRP